MNQLLTSKEAARLLRVGESSVKRWADEGTLPCVKTAGGHRRFERTAVDDFRRHQRALTPSEDPWLPRLLQPGSTHALVARLLDERNLSGSWWRTAETLTPVIHDLTASRASGQLSLLEELTAAEQLTRALTLIIESLPSSPRAPRAILTPSEGDDQTLHLSLAELCLRELGWLTMWTGRRTPLSAIAGAGASHGVRLVVISASERAKDGAALTQQAQMVARATRLHGAALMLVGPGAWPEAPAQGQVLTSWKLFHHAVAQLPPD